MEKDEYFEKRKWMVEKLKRELELSDKVVNAMLKVPRHIFVFDELKDEAYNDYPLSIGFGQTISAPHMVAIMCELLSLEEGNKVLEVGAGSGYHAAVVAEIVGERGKVIGIERIPELAKFARENIKKLGYENVEIIVGDGSRGYEKEAPYDRIYVTASAPDIPPPLIEQLKKGGKMVIPIGDFIQYLYVIEKDKKGRITKKNWGSVRFVPLVGEYGFDHKG